MYYITLSKQQHVQPDQQRSTNVPKTTLFPILLILLRDSSVLCYIKKAYSLCQLAFVIR